MTNVDCHILATGRNLSNTNQVLSSLVHFPGQELLAAGLTEYYSQDELWKKWETLTPREQEVAALVCLGYTNRQAAARMDVTPATVKFHVSNVLQKFQVESRSQLQQLLQEWDFSAWER